MPILYVETNFLIGVSKGHDPEGGRLLEDPHPAIRLAFPTVCLMEAFSVLNWEKKERSRFIEQLKSRSREVGRNRTAPLAAAVAEQLTNCALREVVLLEEFDRILHENVLRLVENVDEADRIAVNNEIISSNSSEESLGDPTDNLILHSVLWHTRRQPSVPKAFVSDNVNDFGQPNIKALLAAAEVRYFRRTDAALGWLRSQETPPGTDT